MTEESKSANGTKWWEYIVGLLAIVGGVASVTTVYDWITKKEPSLVVNCECSRFVLPPIGSTSDELQSKLSEFSRYQALYQMQILNNGTKKADSILLTVPAQGRYQLSRIGVATELMSFSGEIKVGELLPSQYVNVNIWSSQYSDCHSAIRVIHSEGITRAQVDTRIYGTYALLSKYRIFEMVIAALVVLIIGYYMSIRKGNEVTMAALKQLEGRATAYSTEIQGLTINIQKLISAIRTPKNVTPVKTEEVSDKELK